MRPLNVHITEDLPPRQDAAGEPLAALPQDRQDLRTGTVRKHSENIYRRLQVHKKLEAAEAAREKGVI